MNPKATMVGPFELMIADRMFVFPLLAQCGTILSSAMALADQWPIHGQGLQIAMEACHNLAPAGQSAACFLVNRLNLSPFAECSAGSLGHIHSFFEQVHIRLEHMPWPLKGCLCKRPILRAAAKRLLLVVVTRETAAANRNLVITSLSCDASTADPRKVKLQAQAPRGPAPRQSPLGRPPIR